jgi:NAD(P)H-dependent FMN reductase
MHGAQTALVALVSLVVACLVHPNPGPVFKGFISKEENQLFNSMQSQQGKFLRMESHLDFKPSAIKKVTV